MRDCETNQNKKVVQIYYMWRRRVVQIFTINSKNFCVPRECGHKLLRAETVAQFEMREAGLTVFFEYFADFKVESAATQWGTVKRNNLKNLNKLGMSDMWKKKSMNVYIPKNGL